MGEQKVREDRIRRAARRQGLTLRKSRTRDPLALDYGAYMLMDGNTVVLGETRAFAHNFDPKSVASLDDIEAYLATRRR